MTTLHSRDRYDLTGPQNQLAVAAGLATAEWYRTDIPRTRMKELMARSDGRATLDTVLWLGLIVVFGAVGSFLHLRDSLWAIPFFACYGVLYGSAGDSRWHECGHGTAFRTQWKNRVVYQIASFFMMRDPETWRWSHARHHTDTLIVGRDREIASMRPPALGRIFLNFFGIPDVIDAFKRMFIHAAGGMLGEEKDLTPESAWPTVHRTARIWLVIYAIVAATALITGSVLPIILVGGPRLYGAWLHVVFGLTQHAGLPENVLDHRLNCRSVEMNPVLRFLYLNMNWHVEHHMFPMVPYHRLPDLHTEMAAECVPMKTGLIDAYREIIPALRRQRRDPTYAIERRLPTP